MHLRVFIAEKTVTDTNMDDILKIRISVKILQQTWAEGGEHMKY